MSGNIIIQPAADACSFKKQEDLGGFGLFTATRIQTKMADYYIVLSQNVLFLLK